MKFHFVFLLLFFNRICCLSQDTTGTIVNLCDKIGPTIDVEENNLYELFVSIQHFESAVLLQRSDGSYIFKVTSREKDTKSPAIHWIPITVEKLERVRFRIEPDYWIKNALPQPAELSDLCQKLGRAAFAKLKPFQTVRFRIHHGKKIEAKVVSVHGDSLSFISGNIQDEIEISAIDSLWLKGRATGSGAATGGFIIGAGSLISLIMFVSAMHEGDHIDPADQRVIGGLSAAGALGGSLIGAAIGSQITRWHLLYSCQHPTR